MAITTQDRRRTGLFADLNFSLPYVRKATTDDYDIVISIGTKGRLRKTEKNSINIRGLRRRMEEQDPAWLPKTASFANDKNKNMFVVFDNDDDNVPKQHVGYNPKTGAVTVSSKPVVQKFLIVWQIPGPSGEDSSVHIMCKARMVNGNPNVFEIIPEKRVDTLGNGQTKTTKLL